MTPKSSIDALRELLAKATPGPWLVDPLNAWVVIPGADAPICALLWPTELRSEDDTFNNGRFIALARSTLPSILDERESLIARVEVLEEGLRVIVEDGVPRPMGTQWRADKAPSKLDRCTHDMAMSQDCGNCIAEFGAALLSRCETDVDGGGS